MFIVDLGPAQNHTATAQPINAPEYLFGLARYIARTVSDAEVRAFIEPGMGAGVVFRGDDLKDDDVEMF